jgi:hypothetical protein
VNGAYVANCWCSDPDCRIWGCQAQARERYRVGAARTATQWIHGGPIQPGVLHVPVDPATGFPFGAMPKPRIRVKAGSRRVSA